MRFHSASFLSTLLSTFCASTLLLPVFHLHLKVVSQTFGDVSFSWSIRRIRDCVFLHSPSSFSSPTTISRSSSHHNGEFFICQSIPRRVSFLSSHLTSEQPHLAGGQKPLTERKTRSTSPRPHIKGGLRCVSKDARTQGCCLVAAGAPPQYPPTRIAWDGGKSLTKEIEKPGFHPGIPG